MKPPVEHVRVSSKSKEILIKIKRRTGLEHWNEICRIALCYSLANPSLPSKLENTGDSSIDMEWKTFAGRFHDELTSLIILRAKHDSIDVTQKDKFTEYFKDHLERGISLMQNIRNLSMLISI